MRRKNCPTCSFFNIINRQMCIEINRKVAFLIKYSRTKKSKYCCHPPFHPPIFCRHFSNLLSPTLPKLMNWILLSPPPLSSDPDNPPKFGTCTSLENCKITKFCDYGSDLRVGLKNRVWVKLVKISKFSFYKML